MRSDLRHACLPLLALLLAGCGARQDAPAVVGIAAAAPEATSSPTPPVPATGEKRPLTPLELEGRDVFVREGCHDCHAPRRDGDAPRAGAAGRARRGPDLAREGGKYPHAWHLVHLADPRAVVVGSTMPAFASLASRGIDAKAIAGKLAGLQQRGVPYTDAEVQGAEAALRRQAEVIAADIEAQGMRVERGAEVLAVIAYLQRLGRDLEPPAASAPTRPAVSDAAVLERAGVAAVEGEPIWRSTCAGCHGAAGQGLIGPSLTDDVWLHGSSPAQIYDTIARGVPSKGMPAWEPSLGADKVRTMAAFVHGKLARPRP